MAGALMTGTHGGSAHHQSTASMIRGCRMVLADGSIKDIGEVCNAETSLVYMSPPPHALTYTRQDDELLDWVFPSLGMLGIVTRMTLKMVPSYKLRATCTVMSLADFQARACTHAPCLRGTLHPGAPLLSPSNQARRRQTPLPLSRRRSRSLTSPVTTSTHASSSTQPTSRRVCGPFLDPPQCLSNPPQHERHPTLNPHSPCGRT